MRASRPRSEPAPVAATIADPLWCSLIHWDCTRGKAVDIRFEAFSETRPGPKWQALFNRLWPAYRAWYLQDAIDNRATYHECVTALQQHMPELMPAYERLCELAGGGDLEARFLSLYRPPPYLSGCSQAVWPKEPPFLVRNYDYSPNAFDAVVLKTQWLGRRIIGMGDCLVGLTDGMNEDGLVLSLTFGGRRVVGPGFGVPIILRYVLETCRTAPEALNALGRVPCHMAYNVTALDLEGRCGTVYLAPDRDPVITKAMVSTNHQKRVEWASHALATASVERERFLLQQLMVHKPSGPDWWPLSSSRRFIPRLTSAVSGRCSRPSTRRRRSTWTCCGRGSIGPCLWRNSPTASGLCTIRQAPTLPAPGRRPASRPKRSASCDDSGGGPCRDCRTAPRYTSAWSYCGCGQRKANRSRYTSSPAPWREKSAAPPPRAR